MDTFKIRPHLGESALDKSLYGMGWLWLGCLAIVAMLARGMTEGKFWGAGGLPLILLFSLPAIFTLAVGLGYFAQLEIKDGMLLFYGPQVQKEAIKISDIARVNVILLSSPRGGEAKAIEVVTTSSRRIRIPLWFRRQDLSALLQQLKAQSPGIIFDERAELLEKNRPLPD